VISIFGFGTVILTGMVSDTSIPLHSDSPVTIIVPE